MLLFQRIRFAPLGTITTSVGVLLVIVLGQTSAYSQAIAPVLTRNYDNQRTGANLKETILNVSNVNSSQFGKIFMLPVDDQVYAGVLYVPSLPIAGGTHNVVYIETVNNSVYAFDADTPQTVLWQRNFNNGGRPSSHTEVGQSCGNYEDFQGNIGIVGTPVIDPTTRTLYFVSRTVESGQTYQRLHAISILTGLERTNSPVVISASVTGTGDGGTSVVFNTITQNQRAALALSKGVVYIGWASFCDTKPYHGWLMAYDKTALTQMAVFNDTANGTEGGIWMSGGGPAFDASGNLYVATGNGSWDANPDFGQTVLKLAPGTLALLDYFTPSNYNTLNQGDYDLGSSGPTFAPGSSLLAAGGKTGTAYLLNSTNLGHEVSGDTQIPQEWQAVNTTIVPNASHHIHNASPWWTSPEGLNLYIWGEDDYLHGFRVDTTAETVDTTPFASGSILPPQGMPGGMLVVSADASQAGTGIVWAAVPRYGDANHAGVPGNLYAFNAETLDLLWSSTGVGDDLFNFSKGSAPVVVNGKAYVGTLSNFVDVYGLKTGAVNQNLAYLKAASSTNALCNSSQGPAQAVNGSFSMGLNDKWCSTDPSPSLVVDLGANYNVRRFVIDHAGAGGESFSLNTLAYNIDLSTDGVTYANVAAITNNTISITTTDIPATLGRYVRLDVITPTQNGNTDTRIYELQVYGAKAQ